MDVLVILLGAALTLLITIKVYSANNEASRVVIRGPDKTWIFPIEAEETVSVAGSIGTTTVELYGGRAAIISSPCGGQTCVAAGHIHKTGQWAACLPNRVIILVEGGAKGTDGVDAAAW